MYTRLVYYYLKYRKNNIFACYISAIYGEVVVVHGEWLGQWWKNGGILGVGGRGPRPEKLGKFFEKKIFF